MYTLSAQTEQRNFEETRRRLEPARELILSFAMVNGRLPCPAECRHGAPATVAGDEVVTTAPDAWRRGYRLLRWLKRAQRSGLLPARAIGFQQVDSAGFALDAWGNRLRYAVATTRYQLLRLLHHAAFRQRDEPEGKRHHLPAERPAGLQVGHRHHAPRPAADAANQVMNQNLVVAIVFSTGKNGGTPTGGTGIDEAANLNGATRPVFVFHTPTPSDARPTASSTISSPGSPSASCTAS